MEGYSEVDRKLKELKRIGYIKTHRRGDTGIGKTFEDLTRIEENNIPGPNVLKISDDWKKGKV